MNFKKEENEQKKKLEEKKMRLNMFRDLGGRWLKRGGSEPMPERGSFPCSYHFYRHCKYGLQCKYAHTLRLRGDLAAERQPCFQHIIKNCRKAACGKHHEFSEEELLECLE
jgi:hypothetical protein